MIEGTILILAILSIIGFYPIISIIKQHNEESLWMIRPIFACIPVISSLLAIVIIILKSIHNGKETYKEAKEEYWEYKKYKSKLDESSEISDL